MKAMVIALLMLALGTGSVLAAGPLGDDASSDRTIPLATSTTSATATTETGEDVPGPCDEPEHATDPRCAGGAVTTGTTTTTETRGRDEDGAREAGEDVRGPCDEAEHANDPRCTGGAGAADDDRRGGNSGRGGSDDSGSDDSGSGSSGHGGSDNDRSGSNSGSDD